MKYQAEWIKVGHAQICCEVDYSPTLLHNGSRDPQDYEETKELNIEWGTLKFTNISSDFIPKTISQENQLVIMAYCHGAIEAFGYDKFKELLSAEIELFSEAYDLHLTETYEQFFYDEVQW